jgi:TolB-like protein
MAGLALAVALTTAGISLWLRRDRQATIPANAAPVAVVSPRSIAVLPFTNLSPDPANSYFADGVHEDLINNLAKIHDLKVISRTSVMAYRQGPRNMRAIAEDFGVANILEGTVRRSGDEIRVTAQLFDAFTEQPIWADTYDRKLTDVFSIQSDLAQRIATALEANLTADERRLIDRRPTSNQEAYDLYLRARAMDDQLGNVATLADFEPVLALYNQAVAKDPRFALAYNQIAMLNLKLYWFSRLDSTPGRLELAQGAAEAAVRLAPDDPETKLTLGHIDYNVERNWNRALLEFEGAESQLPNDDQAIFAVGFTLRRLGRWNEALEFLERAAARNPRSLSECHTVVETLVLLRRYGQAVELGQQYQVRFPDNRRLADFLLAARYELDGDREAYQRGERALPADPDDPFGLFDRFELAAEQGDWPEADRALADARLTQITDFLGIITDPPALYRARIANLRGDREAARRFADTAIAYYRAQSWVPRQLPWVAVRVAEAEAYAGRSDQAVRDAEAALAGVAGRDALDAVTMQIRVGRIYAIAGRREQALAALRTAMAEPCDWGIQKIRHDPFWSRLADDPRFEATLRSAVAF